MKMSASPRTERQQERSFVKEFRDGVPLPKDPSTGEMLVILTDAITKSNDKNLANINAAQERTVEAVGQSLKKIDDSLNTINTELYTIRSDFEKEIATINKRLENVERTTTAPISHDPEWIRAIERAKRSLCIDNVLESDRSAERWATKDVLKYLIAFKIPIDYAKTIKITEVWDTPESRKKGRVMIEFDTEGTRNFVWNHRNRYEDESREKPLQMKIYIPREVFPKYQEKNNLQRALREKAKAEGVQGNIGSLISYIGMEVVLEMRLPPMRRFVILKQSDPEAAWEELMSHAQSGNQGEKPIPSLSRKRGHSEEDNIPQVDGADDDIHDNDFRLVTNSSGQGRVSLVPPGATGSQQYVVPESSTKPFKINVDVQSSKIINNLGKDRAYKVTHNSPTRNDPNNESAVLEFSVESYELLTRCMFPELTMGWKEDLRNGTMRVLSCREDRDQARVRVGTLWKMLLERDGTQHNVTVHSYDTNQKILVQGKRGSVRDFVDQALVPLLEKNLELHLSLLQRRRQELVDASRAGSSGGPAMMRRGKRTGQQAVPRAETPSTTVSPLLQFKQSNDVCPGCKGRNLRHNSPRCDICNKRVHKRCLDATNTCFACKHSVSIDEEESESLYKDSDEEDRVREQTGLNRSLNSPPLTPATPTTTNQFHLDPAQFPPLTPRQPPQQQTKQAILAPTTSHTQSTPVTPLNPPPPTSQLTLRPPSTQQQTPNPLIEKRKKQLKTPTSVPTPRNQIPKQPIPSATDNLVRLQQREIGLLKSQASRDQKVIQNLERAMNTLRGRKYNTDHTQQTSPAMSNLAPLVENNIFCSSGSADIMKKDRGANIRIFKEAKNLDLSDSDSDLSHLDVGHEIAGEEERIDDNGNGNENEDQLFRTEVEGDPQSTAQVLSDGAGDNMDHQPSQEDTVPASTGAESS